MEERVHPRNLPTAEFLTLQGAATYLNMSYKAFWTLIARGKGPPRLVFTHAKSGNRFTRIRRSDLEEWLKETRCTV